MQTGDSEIDYNDPQFVEVLEACLRKKIAACKQIVAKNKGEVKQMKLEVRRELCRRKELKKKVEETKETISVLTNVEKKLDEQIKEIYDGIALLEANQDDQYKLDQYRIKEYEALLHKCITTWESYHAQYEQLPLAKVRLELKQQIKKASIEQKVLTYKLKEQKKIIKMRNEIDWLHTRAAIVNFVNALVENSKVNKSLTELRTSIEEYTNEFNSLKLQLDEQREYEEEEKRKRVKSLLEMPPPKIDLSHMRPSNYSLKSEQKNILDVTWNETYDSCRDVSDAISVNTVILEELCVIEDESMDETNLINETIQKSCINRAEDGSVAQTYTLNKSNENDVTEIDNNDSSLEIRRINKNFQQQPLVFTSINDRVDLVTTQDQCHKQIPQQQNVSDKEAIMMDIGQSEKDVKVQTEKRKYDSKDNQQIKSGLRASAPVNIIENAIVKTPSVRSSTRPIVTNVEKVTYNVTPMTKNSPGNVTASSMFLPHHYDYCRSDIADNDLITTREMQSMEGSLANCNISVCSNMWNVDDVDDGITECGSIREEQVESMQGEEKAESTQNAPHFLFFYPGPPCDNGSPRVFAFKHHIRWLLCTCILMASTVLSCRQSEFQCGNGACVALNKVCNVIDDCGDGTDEPRQCSPCNRTYYGDVGKTYDMELHRPKEDKVPYICKLTFNAPGGDLGDIVQLTFDSFTLGKFVSFTAEGCPDGSLQISEAQRPDVGGLWCGTSWGPAIYYSETSSVSITLKLLRLSKDSGFNFDFRMAYKMIRKSDAVVRYGNPFVGITQVTATPTTTERTSVEYSNTSMAMPVQMVEQHVPPTKSTTEQYLGDLISGTYCSRIFSDCDRKKCRLQSPNFPGLYPRNLTCYYAVRQHIVPAGKHALISVRQPRGQLVAVRARPASQAEPPPRELRLWQDCDVVQDYVTVYDGYTTRDPVILKFCGGGEPVPETTSSGPEILVEFTTSPYGTFLHPTPPHSLHGFQLEVQVRIVDADSPTYAKNKRCEFWLEGNAGGVLASPRHSLPRNSTCLYHLRGSGPAMPSPTPPRPLPKFPEQRPGTNWRRPAPRPVVPQFRVWLSILKFHVGTSATSTDEDCSATLMVWDGEMMPMGECNDQSCDQERQRYIDRLNDPVQSVVTRPASNTTLLARYCKDKVPRTCDHAILQNTSRPCSLGESFVSSGNSLTIEMRMIESTALRPVNFRALYEFVDLHQDGDPYGSGPCSRIFYSRNRDYYSHRKFQGPKDIFLYGRGGAKNLSCVYRFEGEHDEVVKLRFNRLLNGNRSCRSVSSSDFNRLLCVGSSKYSVKVLDLPWPNAPPVQRDCLCSNRSLPINIKSTSNIVEVHFTVLSMDALDDYNALFFEGTWDFVKSTPCLQKRRVRGPSGEIKYHSPITDDDEQNCKNHPWLIDPGPGQYLYVKMPGIIMSNTTKCSTKNRIVIHTGGAIHVSVCPKPHEDESHHVVEVFSDGWAVSSNAMILAPGHDPVRTIAVEFIISEPDTYTVTWLELTRRPSVTSPAAVLQMPPDCEQRCPELDACINASLWCDGISHCPSGYDEALTHCSVLLQLPPLHLALGILVMVTIIGVICFVAWRICRQRANRSISQHRLKSISSETAIIDGKEVIC